MRWMIPPALTSRAVLLGTAAFAVLRRLSMIGPVFSRAVAVIFSTSASE